MMIPQNTKIFRDNVHGYIKIPIDYVENFIDTDIFQRLRGIEQTGMRVLYPSARHDRFIHSLGTYFLGNKAFNCFKENVRRSYSGSGVGKNHYNIYTEPKQNEVFWDKCKVLFEIACLLHDCGHSPFSHTLEFHYDHQPIDPKALNLKEKLKQYLGSNEFCHDFKGQGSPHERMSALVVCTEFKEKIDKLVEEKYKLIDDDSLSNIEYIARMIIGCKFNLPTPQNQIRNCFIELLNSKSIDVDSLDYIIRDSKLSGIDNMAIDVDRLLGSLTLVEITEFDNVRFRDKEITSNIIEGKLEKNGHQAKISGKCMGVFDIQGNVSGSLRGSIDIGGFFKTLDDVSFQSDNVISVNGAPFFNKLPPTGPASINMYGTLDSDLKIQGDNIDCRRDFNGHIRLSANSFNFSSTFIHAKLDGMFTGKLLGNQEDLGCKLLFQLGFHKSSLSVIQNVIIARNYEYQWIYSHHKVVYYANYLIAELLRQCVKYIASNENKKEGEDKESTDNILAKILSWDTMINHSDTGIKYHPYDLSGQKFFRPEDADIMSLFKRCQIECIEKNLMDSKLYSLLTEYYSRNYRKSLWKSFAEFNIFFSDFTTDEKSKIFSLILSHSSYHSEDRYGYFDDQWNIKLGSFGMKNAVWVNGDSKLKIFDEDNTYILFKDGALTYRTVSKEDSIRLVSTINLFYIYYDHDSKACNIDEFKDYIRQNLSDYLRSIKK